MKIGTLEGQGVDSWNEHVERSPDAWLFHRAEWVSIEARFFATRSESCVVLDGPGRIAALCPLYVRELNRGRWRERVLDSGYHRHAGPAFRADLDGPTRVAAEKRLMERVLQLAMQHEVDRVVLNANSLGPGMWSHNADSIPFWVRDHHFWQGLNVGPNGDLPAPGMATLFADQIVDLRQPEERLFDRLDPNFRKAVRKACGNGLAFESTVDTSIERVCERYFALALKSAERTGEILPDVSYYRSIVDAFHSSHRCAIVFAKHEANDAAALFLLIDKCGAHYLAGVSNAAYLPMRVNNFLHWEAIRWLRQQGLHHYRLGPIFPELPCDWPISQVTRFKGEFGAMSRPIIQGSLFLKPERYLKDALEIVSARCAALPKAVAGAVPARAAS